MEGSYSSIPANYVTLKDLQERWFKRKQEEEEKKLLKLRQEEEEKLLKLRQEEEEKLHKLRQDEESKLRKVRQEEENKRHKEKEAKPAPKSKPRNRFATKSSHSTATSASFHKTREKKAESIENKPTAGINAKRSDAIGDKSEESPAISGSRKKYNRRAASHLKPAKECRMTDEIADKKAEKLEKRLEISRKEPTAEIIRRVANIRVAGADKGRREMMTSSRGSGRFGPRGRISSPGSGMVWVRKTTET